MKVTEKKLDDGRIQLNAIAATAEVAQALNMAQYAFCQQMGVQPQPGKTPAQAAQEQLGIKDLDSMVQQQAVDYLVPFAMDKRNICPAFPPKPKNPMPLKRGQTYSFELRVTPKPAYELSSYDPVSITVPPLELDESEVDTMMEQFAESFAAYVPTEPAPVAKGGACKLSLEASQGGKQLSSLCTEGRTYIMGMQLMPDEFELSLIGMEVGETKSFSFAMPGAPEGDAPIDCTVTILETQKKVVPEITDEWVAKNVPIYRDAKALRGGMADRMLADRRVQYEDMKLGMAATELGRRFKGRIADEVYEAMRESMVANMRTQLAQQGIPFDQYVQSQGGEQQFGMMLMMQTREMLVQGYALDALFRHEKMELTEDDIDEACRQMNPQDPSAARREMEEGGRTFALREMAERIKANKWLLDHANVRVEGQPAAAPAAASAPEAAEKPTDEAPKADAE